MRVSLIGTGLMGYAMVERLLERGHEVTVWNRTRAKAEPLAGQGATVAASAAEAIAVSPATLLMLTDGPATRAALAPEGRFPDLAGRTLIQSATVGCAECRALRRDVLAAGGNFFEAPVLGSTPQARQGRLHVLAGATAEQFERWQGLLADLGTPHRVGEAGEAATFKLAYNQLIGSLLAAFSVSLGLIRRSGLDLEVFMEVLRQTAFYASTFDAKLPRMLARDFAEANFPAKHLLKDVDLVREEVRAAGLEPRLVDALREVVQKALDMGLGDADYSAIYQAVDTD